MEERASPEPDGGPTGHDRRRARSERRILDAARGLLVESGFSRLTIEGVATRSGVAKTTIYRRYRSRTDLALGVLLDMADDVDTRPYRADTRIEMHALVAHTIELLTGSVLGRVMQELVSAVAADPQLAADYREQVIAERLRDVEELLARGAERGELRPGLDPAVVADLLFGPVYYRFFLSGEPLDAAYADALVTMVLPVLEPLP